MHEEGRYHRAWLAQVWWREGKGRERNVGSGKWVETENGGVGGKEKWRVGKWVGGDG